MSDPTGLAQAALVSHSYSGLLVDCGRHSSDDGGDDDNGDGGGGMTEVGTRVG